MSSSVETKCASAPAVFIAARTSASLSARERGANGARVFVDRRRRQRGAVGPDLVEQVDVGAPASMPRADSAALQLTRGGQADDAAVDRDDVARAEVLGEPVDVRGARRRPAMRIDSMPVPASSASACDPVAAVGPHAGEVARDDERAGRAGEPGGPDAARPALRQVFGQVRVGRRDEDGRVAVTRERLAQTGDALAHGGAGRFEGVHGSRRDATSAFDERSAIMNAMTAPARA